jgi:hypothetical protein
MYLIIFEDGNSVLVPKISDADKRAADEGVIDLFDVSVADSPTRYIGEQWENIEIENEIDR